ncbi:MAG: hypothetical protein ACO3CD_04250 [Candidatus Nanopelagicaceae bacterium]
MIDSYVSQTIGYLNKPHFAANLSLTFKSGNGQFIEDAVGNLIENSTTVIVTATVSEDVEPRAIPEIAELGQQIMKLKGRLTSTLPVGITYESVATGVLTDSQGMSLTGIWRFKPVTQNRISSYLLSRNKFIKGTLTIASKV